MRLLFRFGPPLALMGVIFFFSAQPDLSTGLGTWDLIVRKARPFAPPLPRPISGRPMASCVLGLAMNL